MKKKTQKEKHLRDLPGEQWALVPNTEDYYISNKGRFKRITENGDSLRKISIDSDGYCRVNIGHLKPRLHRLVAEAFVPNPNNYPIVDHLDTNKQNCNADNLEWVTHKENAQRASENGLYTSGERTLILAMDEEKRGYLFNSISECSKNLGLNNRITAKVSCGKQKTINGYSITKMKEFEDRRGIMNEKEQVEEIIIQEEWKQIRDTDFYISNIGRFKRVINGVDSFRKISIDDEGYGRINLGKKKARLHRVVAECFVPNPKNLPYVDIIDGNKKNIFVNNLGWTDPSEDQIRAIKKKELESKDVIVKAITTEGETIVFQWKEWPGLINDKE